MTFLVIFLRIAYEVLLPLKLPLFSGFTEILHGCMFAAFREILKEKNLRTASLDKAIGRAKPGSKSVLKTVQIISCPNLAHYIYETHLDLDVLTANQ